MGRIWRFEDNVNTDQIVPGRFAPYMTSEAELPKSAFIEARPEFADQVQPGDVIVAGRNFGCGSSREYAARALELAGVSAIISPLFVRPLFVPLFVPPLLATLLRPLFAPLFVPLFAPLLTSTDPPGASSEHPLRTINTTHPTVPKILILNFLTVRLRHALLVVRE